MRRFLPRSIGMDFTEVNFALAKNEHMLRTDQQTFREIIELIVDCVNAEPYEIEPKKAIGSNMERTVDKLRQDKFPLFHSLQQLQDAFEPTLSPADFNK